MNVPTGWRCPCCATVYAPAILECARCSQPAQASPALPTLPTIPDHIFDPYPYPTFTTGSCGMLPDAIGQFFNEPILLEPRLHFFNSRLLTFEPLLPDFR